MARGPEVRRPEATESNEVVEMTRGEFARCCAGGCGIAGLAPAAGQEPAASDGEKVKELEWKLSAARMRFAKLVGILNANLDEPTRKRVLNALGHECAKSYGTMFQKYKGDVAGFLAEGRKQWMESVEYDEKTGRIRVVDKSKSCTCPLVKIGETPGEFCECTLGWQEEAYSTMLGRPMKARLESSVLRGARVCAFVIEPA